MDDANDDANDPRLIQMSEPKTILEWFAPDTVWEICAECGREFLYPHLCREHSLCGLCHPPFNNPRG
jgi:hypothetical protein